MLHRSKVLNTIMTTNGYTKEICFEVPENSNYLMAVFMRIGRLTDHQAVSKGIKAI